MKKYLLILILFFIIGISTYGLAFKDFNRHNFMDDITFPKKNLAPAFHITDQTYKEADLNDIQQHNSPYQFVEEAYRSGGIEASYPKVVSGTDQEKMDRWNQIIQNDFQQILDIYAFDPFPGLEEGPSETAHLTIYYDITLSNEQFISIFYITDFFNPYAAHPTQLVYTTNIDTKADSRVVMEDLVRLDLEFVSSLKQWNFTLAEPNNATWNQVVKTIIQNMEDEDLLNGLKAADTIGSGNTYGIYTYLTPEEIGVSISVPHFAGDHVELEKSYEELGDYLSENYQWDQ